MLDRPAYIIPILETLKNDKLSPDYKFKRVKIILEDCENMNISRNESTGETWLDMPLMYAAAKGYANILRLFIDAGLPKDEKDFRNDTPLNWASYHGHENCVEILIKAKADLNIIGWNGLTALTSAIREVKPGCLKLLLAAGASFTDSYQQFQIHRYLPRAFNLIQKCDQRDHDVSLALTRLVDTHAVFFGAQKHANGFSDTELLEITNYIKKLNEFTDVYKKNTFYYLDIAFNLSVPAVLIDLILQYDRPDDAPLHDGRLEKFTANKLDGHLKSALQQKGRLLEESKNLEATLETAFRFRFFKKAHESPSEQNSHKRLRLK